MSLVLRMYMLLRMGMLLLLWMSGRVSTSFTDSTVDGNAVVGGTWTLMLGNAEYYSETRDLRYKIRRRF